MRSLALKLGALGAILIGGLLLIFAYQSAPAHAPAGPRKPVDAQAANSEIECAGPLSGDYVTIKITEAGPVPRCLKVRSEQFIIIENLAERDIQTGLDNLPAHAKKFTNIHIYPNASSTITLAAGDYLTPGLHTLRVPISVHAQIWLVE